MEKFYSIKEASKILGVSTNTVYKYVNEKKLKSARIGRGRFKIPSSELYPFLSQVAKANKKKPFSNPLGQRFDSCITPNHNDAHFYHIFEGLLLVGLGLIFILTKGEMFGFSSYGDNFIFFLISFFLVTTGLIRIVTSFYQGYFAKYALITKSILVASEGAYVLFALTQKQYAFIAFVSALMIVNLVRITILVVHSQKVKTCILRFSVFLLSLVIISGLIMTVHPETFPFKHPLIIDLISKNQFAFAVVWMLTFIPLLLFIMSPKGKNPKVLPPLFAFGGIIALIVATQLAIASKLSLAYSSYLTAAFILFISWWSRSEIEIFKKKNPMMIAAFVWVSASILLGLISIKIIQEQAKEEKATKMMQNATSIATSIDATFASNAALMRSIIQKSSVLDVVARRDTEKAIDLARQVYDGGSYIRGGNILNRQGINIGNYPRNSLIIGTNFSSRDYFIDTKNSLKGKIGDFFVNILGNSNIAQTEPFYENNQFAGLISASIDLGKFSMDMGQKIENSSKLLAVDKNNKVVLDSGNPKNIGNTSDVAHNSNKDIYISKDEIVVHKHSTSPDWHLFLISDTQPVLETMSYMAVFLTVILIINGFVSLVAAVVITTRQKQ